MTESFFFTQNTVSIERLSWLVEIMKYYSTRIYPGSLQHHPKTPEPPLTCFFSGDACYCLADRQYLRLWEILFRLPSLRFLFDNRELGIRGISAEPFRIRSPDQIGSPGPGQCDTEDSFWDLLIQKTGGNQSLSLGFLDMESPYMHRSSIAMIDLFRSVVKHNLAPEFYGYLDGVYAVHENQQPLDGENINHALSEISSGAIQKGLSPLFLACSRSTRDRGFNTYSGRKGKIISACTNPQVQIMDLSSLAARFRKHHPILSHSSFFIRFEKRRKIPDLRPNRRIDPPPLILFVSQSPYGTEMTRGALSFALACAHEGISTRVVFIEEGIFALISHHDPEECETLYNLQSLIESTSDRENLEYYSYVPSFQKRGLMGSNILKCVIPVGTSAISKMLFQAPPHIDADHQRALIF